MKLFDNSFDSYLTKLENYNLHSKLEKTYQKFPSDLSEMNNLIFYGPSGVGKYSQFLYSIKKYSPSNLKYEKKITIEYNNKYEHIIKISDIHYEVDISLLGCNAKILWNEIFQHIIDIIISKPKKNGIIVCKNFESIHTELLDIFYSYMQKQINGYCNIIFCLITNNISFIPNNIVNICKIINIPRPSKHSYNKICKIKKYNSNKIINIKQITNDVYMDNNINDKICGKIVDFIKTVNIQNKFKYTLLRDYLYDILIYNLDIYECIWRILNELINDDLIKKENSTYIINKTYKFLILYNNNYRPIYHLELYIVSLIKYIYEF